GRTLPAVLHRHARRAERAAGVTPRAAPALERHRVSARPQGAQNARRGPRVSSAMIPDRSSTPPSFPEHVLSAILGRDGWAESILGDLHEEYAQLASTSRRLAKPRADVWYCLQALALGARSAGTRAARRLSRPDRTLPITTPAHGDSIMRTLGLETRYALRSLWKRPGLSALVILTLALGLGANAAVFENIDALILRPFTIHDVDRVV